MMKGMIIYSKKMRRKSKGKKFKSPPIKCRTIEDLPSSKHTLRSKT